MTALIALVRKDLILFLADRRALVLALLMKISLLALLDARGVRRVFWLLVRRFRQLR